MSKQANTKVIGGFVIGAVVLVISGILLFGSGKFFTHQRKFVLFFEDSVKGLNIGAPVDFRGVKVGTVTDIKIVLKKKDLSLQIPVFIEIEPDQITLDARMSELEKLVEEKGTKTFIQLLVNQGLKAQLAMQSLVTGQLGIHLDFYPDKPLRLVGKDPSFMEIPTIESSLSALSKTLENIPLAEIADKIAKTLDAIEKLVSDPEIKKTLAALPQTVEQAKAFLRDLDGQVKPLAARTELTLGDAQKMFVNAAQLAHSLEARIPSLIASLESTSKSAGETMKGANKAVDQLTGANSPVRSELIKTLSEFSAAARSFRVFAQYLESHPEALIKGKGK